MSIDIGALQVSHIDIGALQLTPVVIPSSGQIFVSNIDSILTADLDGSNSSIIIRDGDNNLEVIGCAYIDIDTINNKLIFMLLGLPSLCRMSELDGTLLENVVLPQSLNIVPSIAIDNSSTIVITNNGKTITGPRIFVADYSNRRIGIGNIVKQKDLTSGNFFTSIIINRFINLIHPPVVVKYDKENNILFWTGEGGVLAKTVINGSPSTIIFNQYLNPLSLTIDPVRRKIYYSASTNINGQTYQGLIQADYNGLNKNLLVAGDTQLFAGLGLDIRLNNFYWLFGSNNQLYRKNITSMAGSTLILDQLDDPRDVKVNLFTSANIQSISRQKSLFINGAIGNLHKIDTPPIPPPTPTTPPPDPEIIPPPTILSLFIAAPEFIKQSMDLFIGSPQLENYLGLYIGGPLRKMGLIDLFIKVQEGVTANQDLFISGPIPINNTCNLIINGHDTEIRGIDLFINGFDIKDKNINLFISSLNIFGKLSDLFIKGFDNSIDNIDLFINGPELIIKEIDLFIHGHELKTQDIELFILGKNILNDKINLSIHGTISGLPFLEVGDDNFGITLDQLFKNADYDPQIIGRFVTDPNIVTIEVWDNNGNIVILTNNNCYQIGDTGRWAWSTINLSPLTKIVNQFIYRMTGSNTEIFESQFILHTRRKNSYKMPENNDHIRKI